MSEQWMNETELMRVRSLLSTFNNLKDMALDDCAVSDANGEKIGTIVFRESRYVFAYPMPS